MKTTSYKELFKEAIEKMYPTVTESVSGTGYNGSTFVESINEIKNHVIPSFFLEKENEIRDIYDKLSNMNESTVIEKIHPIQNNFNAYNEYIVGLKAYVMECVDSYTERGVFESGEMDSLTHVCERSNDFVTQLFEESVSSDKTEAVACIESLVDAISYCEEASDLTTELFQIIESCADFEMKAKLSSLVYEAMSQGICSHISNCFENFEAIMEFVNPGKAEELPTLEEVQMF